MKTKTVNRNIPESRENNNDRFRVKYNDRNSFDKLVINIVRLKTNEKITYIFLSKDLPQQNSIHFTTKLVNKKFIVFWVGAMKDKVPDEKYITKSYSKVKSIDRKQLPKKTVSKDSEPQLSPKQIRRNTIIFTIISALIIILALYLMFRKKEIKRSKVISLSEINVGKNVNSTKKAVDFNYDGINYSIISKESIRNVKCSFNIRLSKKANKQQLKNIAWNLKNNLHKEYQRIFIVYYLPGDIVGSGGWATSHFNPDLEVEIYGSTIEEDRATRNRVNKIHFKYVLGKWIDNYDGCIITLLKKNNTFYIDKAYSDGSSQSKLRVKILKNQKRYYPVENDFEEYYLINKQGNLEVYDYKGYITDYKKYIF